MRFFLCATLVFFQAYILFGQTSLEEIGLNHGSYAVGFKHYTAIDSTRTYQIKNDFNNHYGYRPIPISMWYPATIEAKREKGLTVLDYLKILKEEEEWENLPDHFLLDWFPYLWNTPQNQAHLSENANAVFNAGLLDGKFPVVVYAPSYQASSIENFALCEQLASHGFVVISSPSRGTNSRELEGGTTKDMETQAQDLAFLLGEIGKYKNVDPERIALMGFSFGGLSSAITVMKNKNIRAMVSLDGTERYNYGVLEGSPYFDLDRFTIPYVHFAQKDIPDEVLQRDNIPEGLNYKFQLFDSLTNSNAYRYKFHDLTHAHFSSYGVLFANRDVQQDKSDAKIMASYRLLCQHVLQFLNASLKNQGSAKIFLGNEPEKNGHSKALLSRKTKKAIPQPFDYKDFNDLALEQGYQNLVSLYTTTKLAHPNLTLQEGMLNTLGLRLSFNPQKIQQGINVFLLALHIYPKSANLYDSLAEAYLYNKEIEKAIASFEKSLVLNPENQNAIVKLEQLKN